LYCGITNNLPKRLKMHADGTGSKYVWSHRPFELVWTRPCKDISEALRLEAKLKKLTPKQKWALIEKGV